MSNPTEAQQEAAAEITGAFFKVFDNAHAAGINPNDELVEELFWQAKQAWVPADEFDSTEGEE